MLSFSKLRKHNYYFRRNEDDGVANIDDWKFSPYTCFKSRIYIELSTILAFFFQYTKISPNQITFLYILSGVIGGILFSLDNQISIIIGCIIFYFRSALDWTDGLFARIKEQTSTIGRYLDPWGTYVGHIFFISGLTIYCYDLTNKILYLFILIVILILKTLDFKNYLYQHSFYEILDNQNIENKGLTKNKIDEKKDSFIYNFIKSFMDDRSRTTDSVILIILLNLIYDLSYLIELIVILYFLKTILTFFGYFYLFTKKTKNN